MILTCAFFPEIAGGLFRFKKDHAQYSLKPEDYANKPLFLASKENRFLSEFFLYILEDLHTCQSLPPRRKVRITPAAAARFAPARARARVRACLQHSILYSKLLYSKFTQWEVLLWIIRLGASRFKNLYADLRTYILYCPRAERFASPPPPPPPPHGSRLLVRARRACVCACAPAPRARACARES